MPPVRVRFAPSPTGYLHIGGARTALFNWLWARKEKGTFILRIEDTDRERSTTQSVQAILDGMKWLGLDWDEGPGVEGPHAPYFQTQRLAIYEKSADELIAKGRAYRCVCTKEELDKLRLSRRHGAGSVLQYRDDGYLPHALLNYLARLGWSHGDQEIFSPGELVEKFDWEHVGATAGVFNPEKLLWLDQQWIKRTPLPELAAHLEPLLAARGVKADPERLRNILPLVLERAKTLVEMADQIVTFFRTGVSFDEAAAKKNLTPETRPLLEEARKLVAERIGEGAPALEAGFRDLAARKGLGLGKVAQPVRLAVTGTTVSPPLFETLVLLGRDESLARIDAAISRIGG